MSPVSSGSATPVQSRMNTTSARSEPSVPMNHSYSDPENSTGSRHAFRQDGDAAPAREDADIPDDSDNDSDSKPQVPMQKRRRVTRACDECRRKKIKCDGKQPCTHCTVYSYDCTYDQPSNRRRNPAPQYIEALEQRLQKAERILKSLLPGIDIDDPKYDARSVDQIIETNRLAQSRSFQPSQPPQPRHAKSDEGAQMRSMVDGTGSLDIDDNGYYDYHGHSSGYNFMRRFRAQFGDDFLPHPRPIENRNLANVQESPKSLHSSPFETGISLSNDLPPKHVAIDLCRNAIDDCCALQRPLHRPTFFKRLDSVYSTDPENYSNEHIKFLPLLYTAMAVGCLFGGADDERNELNQKGYRAATEQGYQYFNVAKTMLDVTDCRDLLSIQAVMFMILFLQGTAKLATCYSYVGVALRTCCRLGMHRKLTGKFNVIEQEERKRIFWLVRKMDIYVGAMLGLPQMLSNDDIDQELPSEACDERIKEDGIVPAVNDSFQLMKATNAHTKLLAILRKVVQYVYPIKSGDGSGGGDLSMISHNLIRELEQDLQNWMDELPMELRPSDNPDTELSRVQQLLRMSYAYVQMMIYRPFLHYVAQACQTARTDKRSFACAAACVSVARNIVHITSEMKRRGLLMGSYWFVMYTTYFAILSLLYFVLENPESNTSKDILKDAIEGRDTLANLATRSMAADRCTTSLTGLFAALPEKLNERRSSLRSMPNTGKKRPPPASEPPFFGNPAESLHFPPVPTVTLDGKFATPPRVRTLPQDYIAQAATKRMSMPTAAGVSTPYQMTPETAYSSMGTPADSTGFNSSHNGTPTSNPLDFGTPAMIQGQLPDLKSVMFPGDNPFAYPNQPMSTLDTMSNAPFGHDSPQTIAQYDTPLSMGRQQIFQQDYEKFGGQHNPSQRYNEGQNQNPSQGQNPMSQHFFNANSISNEPGMLSMPQQQNSLQIPNSMDGDDYWSHAPAKGNFRTGLTPGGPGVNLNLDDIFGNANSWNMPLDMNMAGNGQQQGMGQWPGQGGPLWQ